MTTGGVDSPYVVPDIPEVIFSVRSTLFPMSKYRPALLKDNPDPFSMEFRLQTLAKKKGFKSYAEYSDYIAKRKGYSSTKEYNDKLIKAHGFKSQVDYKDHLARKHGLTSAGEYDRRLGLKRRERKRYKEFAEWLNSSLSPLRKDRAWLISKTRLTRQALSLYCRGVSIPREGTFNKIKFVLEPYSNPSLKMPLPPEFQKGSQACLRNNIL
jgi:hypothetical protein